MTATSLSHPREGRGTRPPSQGSSSVTCTQNQTGRHCARSTELLGTGTLPRLVTPVLGPPRSSTGRRRVPGSGTGGTLDSRVPSSLFVWVFGGLLLCSDRSTAGRWPALVPIPKGIRVEAFLCGAETPPGVQPQGRRVEGGKADLGQEPVTRWQSSNREHVPLLLTARVPRAEMALGLGGGHARAPQEATVTPAGSVTVRPLQFVLITY